MGTRTIDGDLEAWVAAGVISAEQADRIRAMEAAKPTHRTGIVREVLGYLGAALLAVAALVLVGDVWDDLSRGPRILLCIGAAAGLIAAGIAVGRSSPDETMRRLSRVCLMLAALPVGAGTGITVGAFASDDVSVLVGFLTATGYAAVVYVHDPSWASHLALFTSVVGTAVAVAPVTAVDSLLWVTGPLLFGTGMAWMVAATARRLVPRIEGEVLGAGALGFGSVLLVAAADPVTDAGIPMMVGMIALAIGCLAIGARLDRVVWLATGVIGLLGYLPWLLTEVFGEGVGVPIGLAVAGAALLAALTRGRARRSGGTTGAR